MLIALTHSSTPDHFIYLGNLMLDKNYEYLHIIMTWASPSKINDNTPSLWLCVLYTLKKKHDNG